jgi:hypothetical protein
MVHADSVTLDNADISSAEIIAVLSNPQVLDRVRGRQRHTNTGIDNISKGNGSYYIKVSGCTITVKVKSHIDSNKVVVDSIKMEPADVCA